MTAMFAMKPIGTLRSPVASVALALSALFLAVACPAQAARAAEGPRFTVRIEGGPAWQSLIDVQIPNDASGTRFSHSILASSRPRSAVGRRFLGPLIFELSLDTDASVADFDDASNRAPSPPGGGTGEPIYRGESARALRTGAVVTAERVSPSAARQLTS